MSATYLSSLTPVQEQVIAALSGGATMKAAAEAAGIHRNTIANWRRTSIQFREMLSHAQYDKALFIREEAENHVTNAFAAIDAILTNANASDSARLNAAKYIIDKASTPPPPQPETVYRIENGEDIENAKITHKNAQSPAPNPETVHNGAQQEAPSPVQTIRREGPKVGRNDPCPCGSHLKFKRCCLEKENLAQAA